MPLFSTEIPPTPSSPPSTERPSDHSTARKRRTGERKARPRSIFLEAPIIFERESSLYKHEDQATPLDPSTPAASFPLGYTAIEDSEATGKATDTIPYFKPDYFPTEDILGSYGIENVCLYTAAAASTTTPSPLTTSASSRPPSLLFSSTTTATTSIASLSVPSSANCSRSSSYSNKAQNTATTEGYDLDQLNQQPYKVRPKSLIGNLNFAPQSLYFAQSSCVDLPKAKSKWSGLTSKSSLDLRTKLRGIGMNSEIWTKPSTSTQTPSASTMTAMPSATLPVVPPRSRLRSAGPPPKLSERNSSLYLLPVDAPSSSFERRVSDDIPSLSSGSSSDNETGQAVKQSKKGEEITFARKKRVQSTSGLSASGDPLRIRDGAMARKASSGLYTPPTFPGPQGPSPSHFPSHVYTPRDFALYPTTPKPQLNNYSSPPLPSRSVSTSSSSTTASYASHSSNVSSGSWAEQPITPTTPYEFSSPTSASFRLGKTFSSIKRISNQIISPSLPSPKTPNSVNDKFTSNSSYFPTQGYAPTVSASWFPTNPIPQFSSTRSASQTSRVASGQSGSGVEAMDEAEGCTTRVIFDDEGVVKGTVVQVHASSAGLGALGLGEPLSSPVQKARRKPVPKMLEVEVGARDQGVVHAM